MKIKFYPDPNNKETGFTRDEIERGLMWLNADIECPHCGKNQAVSYTHYLGGPCISCGELTSGIKKVVNNLYIKELN